MFSLQKLSNYGTATPAIARSILQARDLLQPCDLPNDVRGQVMGHVLEMQRQLVRCLEIGDQVQSEVSAGRALVQAQPPSLAGGVLRLPAVPDLSGKADSFLHAAKLALQATGKIVGPPFVQTHGAKVGNFGFNFKLLGAWCAEALGPTNTLTLMVLNAEPWVKRVVDMRNAIDHPKDKPGARLIVQDFKLMSTNGVPALVDPSWNLLGEQPMPIAPSMAEIIDGIVSVQEDLVIGILENFRRMPTIVAIEIPEAERDPSNPIRFRIGLVQEKDA